MIRVLKKKMMKEGGRERKGRERMGTYFAVSPCIGKTTAGSLVTSSNTNGSNVESIAWAAGSSTRTTTASIR